ncbi:hypothetical protein [Streptomyces canus]|uniref:hypothetical protein n=1 Tax=Streptomyces canus TaxID=58343 RepID=UPI003AF270CC
MGGDPPQPRQRRPPGPAPPRPGVQHKGPPRTVTRDEKDPHDERQMWWWLAYFLFGIHIVAFVMIYAVMHAPK